MWETSAFAEILVIALVGLIVFGPDRLPELARQAGKSLARFRAEMSKEVAELKRAADLDDLDHELKAVRQDFREARRELIGVLQSPPYLTVCGPPPTRCDVSLLPAGPSCVASDADQRRSVD